MSTAQIKRDQAIAAAQFAANEAQNNVHTETAKVHAQYLVDARKEQTTDSHLGGLRFAGRQIPAFKVLKKNGQSLFGFRTLDYSVGSIVVEPHADPDETKACTEGLHVASLDWVLGEAMLHPANDIKVLRVIHSAEDIVAIPFKSDGKYRVKKLFVDADITQELVDADLIRGTKTSTLNAYEAAVADLTTGFVFDGNFQAGDIVRPNFDYSSYGIRAGMELEVTKVDSYVWVRLPSSSYRTADGWQKSKFEFVRRPSVQTTSPTRNPKGPFVVGDMVIGVQPGSGVEKGVTYLVERVTPDFADVANAQKLTLVFLANGRRCEAFSRRVELYAGKSFAKNQQVRQIRSLDGITRYFGEDLKGSVWSHETDNPGVVTICGTDYPADAFEAA